MVGFFYKVTILAHESELQFSLCWELIPTHSVIYSAVSEGPFAVKSADWAACKGERSCNGPVAVQEAA